MNTNTNTTLKSKRPWHLWLVGILSFLWYLSGTYAFLMAQTGRLTDISADEAAYYSAQPIWLAVLTDISLFSALIASMALLLKYRLAFTLYSLSLTTILLTNMYDLIAGTSRMLSNTGSIILTPITVVIAVFLLFYSRSILKRGD